MQTRDLAWEDRAKHGEKSGWKGLRAAMEDHSCAKGDVVDDRKLLQLGCRCKWQHEGDEKKMTLPEMLEINWKGEESLSEQCSLDRFCRHGDCFPGWIQHSDSWNMCSTGGCMGSQSPTIATSCLNPHQLHIQESGERTTNHSSAYCALVIVWEAAWLQWHLDVCSSCLENQIWDI